MPAKQPQVQIYTKAGCPYCGRAKALLDKKQVVYQELRVENHPELKAEMEQRSGHYTVPQIFIANQSIGGCDDLYALDAAGTLDKLLQIENKIN